MYLDRLSLRPSYMASSVWAPMLCGVCLYGKWRVQHGAWRPDEIMGALREEQPSGSLSQVSGVMVPDMVQKTCLVHKYGSKAPHRK